MPTSRITEIAQVAAAFTAMGEGLRAAASARPRWSRSARCS
jgi:hypothetical protein